VSAIEAILFFDGKHVDQLKSAVSSGIDEAEWGDVASFFDHDEVRYQTASTWLVKAALEKAQAVPSLVIGKLLQSAKDFADWEAKLHFLQSIQYFDASAGERQQFLQIVQSLEGDKKVLVNVWALDAFVRLAAQDPALTKDCAVKLDVALNHKAASMRARARNLLKEFPQFAR